jgi:excisionase family DNA binding protein
LTLSTHFREESISPSDWISQAEAAHLRGVSRQAISKLVRKGRLRTIVIGGRTLVSRAEVLAYRPRAAGRPRSGRGK